MLFIVVEVEQETGAPPPKKKCWIRPFFYIFTVRITTDSACAQCLYSRTTPGHYR